MAASDDDSNYMERFFAEHPVDPTIIKHFESIPWTNKFIQNSAYEPIPAYSRTLKPTGEDYFYSTTINTPSTIPYYLLLRLRDLQTPTESNPKPSGQENIPVHKQVTVVPEQPDCIFLVTIGKSGVDGHAGVMHGGMTCVVLDETMGLMTMLHMNNITKSGPRDPQYTAYLNVTYRAQVPTPGEVIVRTWLTSRQGRKYYARGQLVDKDGNVLVEGEGLWVAVPSSKI